MMTAGAPGQRTQFARKRVSLRMKRLIPPLSILALIIWAALPSGIVCTTRVAE